jgi:hypothetical protein
MTDPVTFQRRVIADPDGFVNPGNNEVEIDIFCENPLIIGECTTFVKDIKKVEKFCKVKEFVHKEFVDNLHKIEPIAYLFTYGIDEKIQENVVSLCNHNNITLVYGKKKEQV